MMTEKKTLNMYDNDTLKWEHDGKLYCLHIQTDEEPMNPRRDWENPGTLMACWHRNYDLGDEISDKEPEDFWKRLVRENVPGDEYPCADELTIQECMDLMRPYAVWLPLWLYDHSGITMSCGARSYPYNDRWDSGQVGWIVTTKEAAIKEIGYTEADWRERSLALMEAEVALYDRYLTGDTYGFTLYEADPPEQDEDAPDWNEIDSCWGFYGSDIFANGIADDIGNGFDEAVTSGAYGRGKAEKHIHVYYEF